MAEWRDLWIFNDPVESELRFARAAGEAETAGDTLLALELHTQVARARGLQRHYGPAQETLDMVAADLPEGDSRARYYWLIESGRVKRSSDPPQESRPDFEAARAVAKAVGYEYGEIDAVHMLALVAPPEEAVQLHDEAIALARDAVDPMARKWRATLLNNQAWTRFDRGELEMALGLFQEAVEARREMGDAEGERIALWCEARCRRELGQSDEAWTMQQELLAHDTTGFVSEELAILASARGDADFAREQASEALRKLVAMDSTWPEQEPERYAALQRIAG